MKVRTSVLRGFALLALSSLAFTACDDKAETIAPPVEVTITVTPQSAQLQVGQTTSFVAVVGGSANQTVTWASSTPAVATVNPQTGVVTAVTPGTTTITATSAADATKRAAAQVIVVAPPPPPPPVTVAVVPAAATIPVGGSVMLQGVVGNATNTAVRFTSLNDSIATVSQAGLVTGVRAGNTAIRVQSLQDTTKFAFANITVTAVTPPPPPPPPAVTVTIVPSTVSLVVNGTLTFSAASSAPNDTITFTSSNPAVLSIDASTGAATANAAGNAIVTARSRINPNSVATASVTVTAAPPPPPVTLSVSPSSVTLVQGRDSAGVVLAVTSSAANDTVSFTSSNVNVASVDANGRIRPVGVGNAIITVRSSVNPNVTASVNVSVLASPPVTQPAVSIQQVLATIGGVPNTPATPGGVAVGGSVRVTMNVSAGSEALVTEVRALLISAANDTIVGCSQTFNPPLSATQGVQTIDCVINTASVVNGQVVIANGAYTLQAHAITTTNTDARATWGTLNVFNANVLGITLTTNPVSSTGPVIGGPTSAAPGLLWNEGDVVVTLSPLMFAGGQVSTVTVCLTATGQTPQSVAQVGALPGSFACRQVTTPVGGPFTVTFPKATSATGGAAATRGVGGVEATGLTATATSTTVAGTPGPGAAVAIRLDNLAPTVTSMTVPNFNYINGSFSFGGGNTAFTDTGSDSQTIEWDIVLASSVVTVAPGGANVTNASTVAESQTNQQYALRARVTDALGNTRTYYATTVPGAPASEASVLAGTNVNPLAVFGVDRTAPVIAGVLLGQPGANSASTSLAGAMWSIQYQDASTDPNAGPSGFAATPLRVRLVRFFSGDTDGMCIDPRDGVTVVSANVNERNNTATAPPPNAPGDPNASATGCYFWITTDVMLPGGAAATAGYYVVAAQVYDAAGNPSGVFTRTTLRDAVAPQVGAINVPTSITGNSNADFSALMTDNVELGDNRASVGYNGLGLFLLQGSPISLAAYGPESLTFSAIPTTTITQFIRTITGVDGTGAALQGTQDDADQIAFQVRDMAGRVVGAPCPGLAAGDNVTLGNCHQRIQNIQPAIIVGAGAGGYTTWASVLDAGSLFRMTQGTAVTRCNGSTQAGGPAPQPCPTNSQTPVALSATLTGNAQTFANPFQRVEFWTRIQGGPADGTWALIGTATTVSVTDNQQTLTRTWTYSGVSFDPLGMPAGTYDIFALGVRPNGDALMSTLRSNITVAID